MAGSPNVLPFPGTSPLREAEAVAAAGWRSGPRPAHVDVGPLSVFNGSFEETVDLLADAIRTGSGARVATANLDFVARARRDKTLRDDLAAASLVVADGSPVTMLARAAGGSRTGRVPGVDLVGALCARAGELGGLRAAIYGSDVLTAMHAATNLESANPGLQFVATICPPFRKLSRDEEDADIAALADSEPDVVFVALGCPRQERLIAEHWSALPNAVWIGVGGTFDFYAGKRLRAPRVAQAVGAEWLVRLAQEPRRLWRRYFVDDIPALVAVAPGCLRRRQKSHAGAEALRAALLRAQP